MDLRPANPAFLAAMKNRNIDLAKATRQEMRTYVCAQCHVEYYFETPDRPILHFRGKTACAWRVGNTMTPSASPIGSIR